MNKLKELNNKLKNRLDKIEEEQKNKQKDIDYLLKRINNLNNNDKKEKDNEADKVQMKNKPLLLFLEIFFPM